VQQDFTALNSLDRHDKAEGAILVDQLKSLDWAGRQAQFHSKAEATLLRKVRQYIAVLLGIR
jgi:mRNA interferase MazF